MSIRREHLGLQARLIYDRQKAMARTEAGMSLTQAIKETQAHHRRERAKRGREASARKAEQFIELCRRLRLPEIPVAEHRFHPSRMWRFDLAFPRHKIAIEIQGGAFIGGRHNRGGGFIKDMEKMNAAAILGWRIIYRTPADFMSDETVELVQDAMRARIW